MKVLQVGLSYNPGGIETCILSYYREICQYDVQFDFVCMYSHLAFEDEILDLGGHIYYTSDIKKHPLRFRKELAEIIGREKYDVVHVNMLSAANIVPLVVARACGVKKVIAHSHNSSSPGLIRNLLHIINKASIPRYATHFFACSQTASKWLFTREIYNSKKYILINNAIDLNRFCHDQKVRERVRKTLDIDEQKVIGHVGRFEEQKNHEYLIRIFSEICQKTDDYILLLVGEGELQVDIKRQVKELGLSEKVYFLGVRKDVNNLLQAMDIFVLPSLFEGLPVVAVEAQAMGIYCILSDIITKEVGISDRIMYLNINESAERWAEVIINNEYEIPTEEQYAHIKKRFVERRYEIKSATKYLYNLYTE